MITLDKPILIYQVGKVGSQTVQLGILDLLPARQMRFQTGLCRPAHHIHSVDNDNSLLFPSKKDGLNDPVVRIEGGVIPMIVEEDGWNVVTIVRDPVARNFSAWNAFQNRKGDFIEDYLHDAMFKWFDRQLVKFMGVNVYDQPFDAERGWSIYHNPSSKVRKLLILQTERIDEVFAECMTEFLEIEVTEPPKRVNTASYVPQKLPQSYQDEMYASEYARHFYTPSQIASFRHKWSKVVH